MEQNVLYNINILTLRRKFMKRFKRILCTFFIALCVVALACCGGSVPKDLNSGMTKMENAGYTVEKLAADDVADMLGGINIGVVTTMLCEKEVTEDTLIVMWFNDEEKAKSMESIFKLAEDEIMGELDSGEEVVYKTEGKVFFCGTKDACDAFSK